MNRRRFLHVSARAASGMFVLGSSSCASIPKLIPFGAGSSPLPDMDAYVARVDAGLERIGGWSATASYPDFAGDREKLDTLGRTSLRTLYATGMLGDLPEEGQRHPAMQERIWNMLPEMDDATTGVEAYLAAQTSAELERLQLALRSRENPAMQIFEGLDEQAALCHVSPRRRLQTRVMMTETAWRLRNQPPALVIRESLHKVERLAATDISREAREDEVLARVSERHFWRQQAGGEPGDSLIVPSRSATADSLAPRASVSAATTPDGRRSLRDDRLRRGARKMGIGILIGGVSAIAIAADAWPFVFVATAGAILLLIGLITILVGLATSKDARTSR